MCSLDGKLTCKYRSATNMYLSCRYVRRLDVSSHSGIANKQISKCRIHFQRTTVFTPPLGIMNTRECLTFSVK